MEEHKTEPQRVNPIVDRLRIPGETFRLPSQGLFYNDGELDPSVRNGEVEVYPMTAMDEIIISTPDKLLSGKAILEVFGHCVPMVLKPEALLAKDVDFLMACLRLVSFGPQLPLGYKHTCENAKEHTYTIALDKIIKDTRQIDPTTLKSSFELTVPNGQRVQLRPLSYGAIMKLYETTAMTKTEVLTDEEARNLIVGALANVVASVDDVTEVSMIEEWVTKIPLGWKRQIEQAAQKTNMWGVDFQIPHKCQDCNADITLEVAANPVSFFT